MRTDIVSQIKILSASVVVIFVFLALASAFLLDGNSFEYSIPAAENLKSSAAPLPSSLNNEVSKSVSFLKYQNNKYAYAVEYPENWIIDIDNEADIFVGPRLIDNDNLPIPHEGALEIKVISVGTKTSLEDLAIKYKEDGIDFTSEEIKIDNISALKINTRICQASACHIFEWFAINNGNLYKISTIYPDISYNKDFNRIISSFRFLNSAE